MWMLLFLEAVKGMVSWYVNQLITTLEPQNSRFLVPSMGACTSEIAWPDSIVWFE